MTMLREFFDLTKDSRALFEGLNIMETEYAHKLNSTPVIYLTFKNCEASNLEDLLKAIAKEILNEYERYHTYMGNKLDENELAYHRFLEAMKALSVKIGERIDTFLLQGSLEVLIRAIQSFTGVKPIVLIDEYDQPIIAAHRYGFRESFSMTYAGFLTEGLKGNDYLGQAVMTGIQRVAKESIFSKLNHFVVYSVLDVDYSTYFGLTTQETKQTLEDFGIKLTEDIKDYYDGYQMGKTDIYNPWSIFCYIKKRELQSFWIKTSTNALIRESILSADGTFKKAFERLIINDEVAITVNLEAAFLELRRMTTLWGLLVNAGYLTVVEKITPRRMKLKIPNKEVKEEFRSIVADYARLDEAHLEELFDALMVGEMEEFLDVYRHIVDNSTSYFDAKEQAYHSLFFGMVVSVWGLYTLKSNAEAGDGRADIMMESLNPSVRPHIIIEFKYGSDIEQLKEVALNQIFEKRYHTLLKGPILCLGIAITKKQCALTHKLINN